MTQTKVNPVVISGIGIICPLGQDTSTVWRRALAGDAISEPIPDNWWRYADHQSHFWAPLPEIDYSVFGLNRWDALRMDPVAMLAIGACHQALDHAGIDLVNQPGSPNNYSIANISPDRIGIFMGTGIGGIQTVLNTHLFHSMHHSKELLDRELLPTDPPELAQRLEQASSRIMLEKRFNPLAVTMLMPNAVSAVPGIRFGAKGPNKTFSMACASGTVAIGEARRAVASGEVDLAICGGAEYLYDDYGSIFRTYDITGALARGFSNAAEANRPFDKRRNGFLLSQGGAAVLILENAESANSRGAIPLAELSGCANGFDAYNLIAMQPGGAQIKRMLVNALGECRIDPASVDYINAHGTGTDLNDDTELSIIDQIFRPDVFINSTKGLIGHSIGASGAIEAAITTLSIKDGRIHPCHNLENPLQTRNFPLQCTTADIKVAISQSFAFGGHNSCLVFRRIPAD